MLWKWLDDKITYEDKETEAMLFMSLQRAFDELSQQDINKLYV